MISTTDSVAGAMLYLANIYSVEITDYSDCNISCYIKNEKEEKAKERIDRWIKNKLLNTAN